VTDIPSALDWLPSELAPVALRLARADELEYELGVLCLEWSREALTFKNVRDVDGRVNAVIESIRQIPPAVPMLFSETVNHLRAAVDNVVFYFVRQARGGALAPREARQVAMPICQSAEDLTRWLSSRRRLVPELDAGTALHSRIESLQPFRNLATVTAVPLELATFLETLTGSSVELHGEHPLSLLQGYSNEDKHRMIRPALCRSLVTHGGRPLSSQSLDWVAVAVGDIVSRDIRAGRPVVIEAQTSVQVQRPDSDVWVAPGIELDGIHGFIADTLIPTLITGAPAASLLPRRIDLSDNGETAEERIRAGSLESAHKRAGREAVALLDETGGDPPQIIPMPD
jgi:hypothetical protein